MRFINYFLILTIITNSIQCVRIRRNRNFGRQVNYVNRTAVSTGTLPLQLSEVNIENVTEIFVTQNPDTSSVTQKEIERLVDNFKSSKYDENITKEVPLYNVRQYSEKAQIINIEIEKHSELKHLELECKFGNVSD